MGLLGSEGKHSLLDVALELDVLDQVQLKASLLLFLLQMMLATASKSHSQIFDSESRGQSRLQPKDSFPVASHLQSTTLDTRLLSNLPSRC